MTPLKRGATGDDVRRLQALLCLCGHDAKPIDGDFGSGTERALRLYQAAKGLHADGELRAEAHRLLGMDEPDPTRTPVPVIDRFTVDMVARMFADAPRANVERYLPPVLAALKAAGLDDRDMVLMALGTFAPRQRASSRSRRSHRSTTPAPAVRIFSTSTTTGKASAIWAPPMAPATRVADLSSSPGARTTGGMVPASGSRSRTTPSSPTYPEPRRRYLPRSSRTSEVRRSTRSSVVISRPRASWSTAARTASSASRRHS